MGRDSTITQDQVSAAAAAMCAEGVKPTSRSIRDRLGSGSMGTINKMFQHWKNAQAVPVEAVASLPPALQGAILNFMSQETAKARASLEAELSELGLEIADIAIENERLAETIETQAKDMAKLATEKAAAEGKSAQLSLDISLSREEAQKERQGAAQARSDLDKANLRLEAIPKLEAELREIQLMLEKERGSRIAFEQESAVVKSQKVDLELRLAEAKDISARNADLLTKAEERADKFAADITDVRVANQVLQTKIEAREREAGEAKSEAERLKSEAKAAREEAAELRGQLSAKK